MKVCKDCGELKELGQFYKHKQMADGHLNSCKDCVKARVTNHRGENLERIQKYDRNRPNSKERVAKCGEKAKVLRESGDEVFLEKERNRIKTYRRENEPNYKAHNAVSNALRDGKLFKPAKCEACGDQLELQGHHWSYEEDNWLDVLWLCAECHGKEHKRLNAMKRGSV